MRKNPCMNFLDDIILPNIQQERKNFGCENKKDLMIYDVFSIKLLAKLLNVWEETISWLPKFCLK